jgi:hypothetical protein
MRKEIINEIKQMQKLMIYNWAKTDTENTQIFEQIIGTPPDASGGGNTGGGNTGGGNTGGRRGSGSLLPIPSELANSAGVKKFQDWLVANNFGSELGRFGADSKFGNFTKAAWDKHKSAYLNPVESALIPGNDITNVEPSSVQSTGGATDPSGVTEPSSVVVDPSTVSQQDRVASGGTPLAGEDITQNI